MKSAGKARSNGLYRHIRTSKEIIRNLLNYYYKSIMVRPIGRTEKMTAAEQETAAVIFACLEKCCQETNTATTSA